MPRITASTTLTTAPADILAYRLVPSHTSVNIRYVNGVLTPDVANITLRVTKQQGEDTPVTVQPSSWGLEGLTVGFQYLDGDTEPHASAGENIPVVAAYKGIKANLHRGGVVIDSVTVGFTVDGKGGDRGSRGPALRFQRWEDVPVGFQFENGAEGCTYLDVVTYGTGFYSCRTSHAKNASVPPPTGVSAAYMQWIGTTPFDILATKLFFADYALIENLGVESLEMYARDSSGNIIKNADGTNKIIARMKDGVIEMNTGVFRNIKVVGSLRNPFANVGGSFETDYNDNVVMISSGGGWVDAYSLPWDVAQSGRRIMIVNYKWGNSEADGYAAIDAPTGQYFYEDGIARSSLKFSREAVELMGYGTPTQFYGWIVTKRIDLMTRYKYGKGLKALAFGSVTAAGGLTYKTFDGSTLSASKTSGVDGQYTITMPNNWFAEASDCMVLLTGLGYVEKSTTSPVRATLISRTTTQFVVRTADDETPNNGAFEFIIINKNDWI